jgi:hypothetical protein
MESADLNLYARLLNEVRGLLNNKEKLGITNLPLGFNGFTSDLLYQEGIKDKSFVLFVDALVQECSGSSDEIILERFMLVEKILTMVYERNKKLSSDPGNENTQSSN